jgi:hypothetical protein
MLRSGGLPREGVEVVLVASPRVHCLSRKACKFVNVFIVVDLGLADFYMTHKVNSVEIPF